MEQSRLNSWLYAEENGQYQFITLLLDLNKI